MTTITNTDFLERARAAVAKHVNMIGLDKLARARELVEEACLLWEQGHDTAAELYLQDAEKL